MKYRIFFLVLMANNMCAMWTTNRIVRKSADLRGFAQGFTKQIKRNCVQGDTLNALLDKVEQIHDARYSKNWAPITEQQALLEIKNSPEWRKARPALEDQFLTLLLRRRAQERYGTEVFRFFRMATSSELVQRHRECLARFERLEWRSQ